MGLKNGATLMKKKELKGRKTYLEVDDEKFATAMIVFESMKIKRETRERERNGKIWESDLSI